MDKKFVTFLCKNNAYQQYMHNLAYIEKGKYGWEKYYYTTYYKDWLTDAFDWKISPEGHKFWLDLHIKWREEL